MISVFRKFLPSGAFGLVVLGLLGPAPAAAQEIWFNMTNYAQSNGVDGPQGWNKLFVEPDAPWPGLMDARVGPEL